MANIQGYTAEVRDGVIHVVKPNGSFYRIRGGKCECVAGKRGKDCKHLEIAKAQLGTSEMAGPNSFKKKMPLADGVALAADFMRLIDGYFSRLKVAGSIRRYKSEIGDIDILGIRKPGIDHHQVAEALESIGEHADNNDVVIKSGTGDSSTGWSITLTFRGQQINLMMLAAEQHLSWGAALVYATGNTKLNVELRARARKNGQTLNQYHLLTYNGEVHFQTEEELFAAFGLKYIPPEDRALVSNRKADTEAFWKKWAL